MGKPSDHIRPAVGPLEKPGIDKPEGAISHIRKSTPTPAATQTKQGTAGRWLALDFLRFVAVLLMLQGHAFHVMVNNTIRAEPWYRWHNYVHGFTAPLFLFASGLAFGITTLHRWEQHTWGSKAARARIRRYLTIIAIGYLLHMPGFSLTSLATAHQGAIRSLLKVDALQNIGLSLIGAELLVCIFRKKAHLLLVLGGLGIVFIMAAPMVAGQDYTGRFPTAISNYLNSRNGSIFPLFPWTGFIYMGVLMARSLERPSHQVSPDRPPPPTREATLLALGCTAILVASFLAGQNPGVMAYKAFWKTSPVFFLWRAGIIFLFLALLCKAEYWMRTYRRSAPSAEQPRWLRFTQIMSQETLVIYVIHLLILYGFPLFQGFHATFGRTLAIGPALAMTLLLLMISFGIAYGWHVYKRDNPKHFKWLQATLTLSVVVYMFIAQ